MVCVYILESLSCLILSYPDSTIVSYSLFYPFFNKASHTHSLPSTIDRGFTSQASTAMSRFSVAYLTALALIPSVITALHSPLQSPPSQQGTTLHPINILDYEASIGLQRRASNDLSVIEPQNQTEMMYKSADGKTSLSPAVHATFTNNARDSGAHLLAHMTLQAPDGLPIVLLEHFQELVVEINCRDQEGRLDLKWDSVNAFEVAKSQWNYVNKDEKGRFLVIANQDGCGQTGQRQGYVSVII